MTEAINPEVMFEFIEALREGKLESKAIPQFSMRINSTTGDISSREINKVFWKKIHI